MIFPWNKRTHEELDKIQCLLNKLAKSQKELRMYKQVWDHSNDAMFILIAPDGIIMDANTSAEKLYGYKKQELLGMKITDLSDNPEATTGTFVNRLDYVPLRYHKNKDGDVFPITATVSFFKEMNGIENEYAVVMCRLITPEIKREICDE